MANKASKATSNLLKPTEAPTPSAPTRQPQASSAPSGELANLEGIDLDEGVIIATGVGLKGSHNKERPSGELAAVQAIAAHHNIARNALLRIAVREFLERYKAGEVDMGQYITTEQKQVLKIGR